jgi:uncharacterized protein (DUF2384 family)
VTQILSDSLTRDGVGHWLRAPNRMLGARRPLDLIDEGGAARVEEAAQAFVDGAYV